MTQRIIYGKTVTLQGDNIKFDGRTTMDAYPEDGITPIYFQNTVYANVVPTSVSGLTVARTIGVSYTRNDNWIQLSIGHSFNSLIPTGTSFTFTINSVIRPLGNTSFVFNLRNNTANNIAQAVLLIDTAGLCTVSGLTAASDYSFLYGAQFPRYFGVAV